MNYSSLGLALVLAAATSITTGGGQPADQWPNYQHNALVAFKLGTTLGQ